MLILAVMLVSGCAGEPQEPKIDAQPAPVVPFQIRSDAIDMTIGPGESFLVPIQGTATMPSIGAEAQVSFSFTLTGGPLGIEREAFIVQVHEIGAGDLGRFTSMALDGNDHVVSLAAPAAQGGSARFALIAASASTFARHLSFRTADGSALGAETPTNLSGAFVATKVARLAGGPDRLSLNVDINRQQTPGLAGTHSGWVEAVSRPSSVAGWWYGCVHYTPGGNSKWRFERTGSPAEEGSLLPPSMFVRHWAGEAPVGATARLSFNSTAFSNDTGVVAGESFDIVVLVIAPPEAGWPVELARARRDTSTC